jgi:hypothetical protein
VLAARLEEKREMRREEEITIGEVLHCYSLLIPHQIVEIWVSKKVIEGPEIS